MADQNNVAMLISNVFTIRTRAFPLQNIEMKNDYESVRVMQSKQYIFEYISVEPFASACPGSTFSCICCSTGRG